ncbi:MAG TPA: class I SAM-dependent rRNA methyltransferase [Casimicrobiaceae bacterium]|nr:class I SAM-dependent rRNA methyltransferase [Casimicrobiaceae bacterium]
MLKPGRDKSVRARHPWIFSGAIARVDDEPDAGATVAVHSADGEPLALAAYSPLSQIRARVWSFDPADTIDAAFLAARVHEACSARRLMLDERHTGVRLVHAESDRLPGVVADFYGDTVVLQLSAAGADAWRDAIVEALAAATGASCIYERSDAEVRALEGLGPRVGVVHGRLPATVEIVEDGLRYRIDVAGGQKTGFYLDQRDNRARVGRLARDRRVLNAFCYTGGFTLAALAGGATQVLSIDSAQDALALARHNLSANPALDATRAQWHCADVFTELRRLRNEAQRFDLIVLDPPKFAPTAAHAERAARAYKDINLLALKLLAPGGLLATFSCSGGVDAALFQKIVAGAAVDAGADATILARLAASPDHPVALAFPEGEYLKGLLLRKG